MPNYFNVNSVSKYTVDNKIFEWQNFCSFHAIVKVFLQII